MLAQAISRHRCTANVINTAPQVDTITIPVGPRLGDLVLEADHLRKAFGERLLMEDATFRVPPGAVVGIIGGNGAGKSTLFRWAAVLLCPCGGLGG